MKKRLPKVCLKCGGPISKKWAKIIVNHLVSENQICENCDDKIGEEFIRNYNPTHQQGEGNKP